MPQMGHSLICSIVLCTEINDDFRYYYLCIIIHIYFYSVKLFSL